MKLRTIENLDVRGKFVLLRDDFNVQIVDGKITDPFRIEQSMPTINALRAGGAKIAICAHLGRPKGTRNMEFSMRPVAEYMGVPLIADCLDKEFMTTMHDSVNKYCSAINLCSLILPSLLAKGWSGAYTYTYPKQSIVFSLMKLVFRGPFNPY